MLSKLLKLADKQLHFDIAQAHCDIPCKIYDPSTAQLAALSVIRFMDLIQEVGSKDNLSLADHAQLARLVSAKEAEAEKVKQEIRVIWGDYFKTPQFEQFPNIHELVHSIMMTGSASRQGVEREKGEKLLNLVNEFAAAFWTTKGIETFAAECPYPPNMQVIYPKLN